LIACRCVGRKPEEAFGRLMQLITLDFDRNLALHLDFLDRELDATYLEDVALLNFVVLDLITSTRLTIF
jgi:hypothetical protein